MIHEEIPSPANRIELAADLLAEGLLRLAMRGGLQSPLSAAPSSKGLDFLEPKREHTDSTEAG